MSCGGGGARKHDTSAPTGVPEDRGARTEDTRAAGTGSWSATPGPQRAAPPGWAARTRRQAVRDEPLDPPALRRQAAARVRVPPGGGDGPARAGARPPNHPGCWFSARAEHGRGGPAGAGEHTRHDSRGGKTARESPGGRNRRPRPRRSAAAARASTARCNGPRSSSEASRGDTGKRAHPRESDMPTAKTEHSAARLPGRGTVSISPRVGEAAV